MSHDDYWRDIPGEPLYQAHPTGKIRSKRRVINTRNKWNSYQRVSPSRELVLNKASNGYLVVSLAAEGKKRQGCVHRLIAKTFIPNPKNKPCVNHKDSNRCNNNVDNLEWVSHKENTQHAITVGRLTVAGAKSASSKVTPELYEKMLRLRREGLFLREIAEKVGLHLCTVSRAFKRGKSFFE